jgi:hypothetical protein
MRNGDQGHPVRLRKGDQPTLARRGAGGVTDEAQQVALNSKRCFVLIAADDSDLPNVKDAKGAPIYTKATLTGHLSGRSATFVVPGQQSVDTIMVEAVLVTNATSIDANEQLYCAPAEGPEQRDSRHQEQGQGKIESRLDRAFSRFAGIGPCIDEMLWQPNIVTRSNMVNGHLFIRPSSHLACNQHWCGRLPDMRDRAISKEK